jgi:hypothetical protein
MIVNQLDPALRSRFVLRRAKTAAGLGREHRLYFLGLWVRRSIGAQYRRGNGDHGVLPIPFCGIYLTPVFLNVRFAPIALLNSKNGLQRFFREKSNQATIADRCVLKRATEVAGEVIASCCGPPARLFDRHAQICLQRSKKSFATLAARSGHSPVATNRLWVDGSAGQMGAADLYGSRCFEAFRSRMIV